MTRVYMYILVGLVLLQAFLSAINPILHGNGCNTITGWSQIHNRPTACPEHEYGSTCMWNTPTLYG